VTNGAVTVIDLSPVACFALLGAHAVGRLCVIENDYPVAFPMNYRLVFESDEHPVIVLRARSGSAPDVAGNKVGFLLDGIDPIEETGWSVLARGILRDGLVADAPKWLKYWNPRPWAGPRNQWLYLPVQEVTGRRLLVAASESTPRHTGYL
jgi:Pyridoxamine 5'-phosphate oxidase